MPKNRVILLILTVLFLGTAASGMYMLARLNLPLGPSLALPTWTSTSAPHDSTSVVPSTTGEQNIGANLSSNSTQAAVATPIAVPSSQPLCDGPATMTILAIGSDARSSGYKYGLADSIHVMRIDFTVPSMMIIDFPRDLWVEIPEIADHQGINHGKLNQAYLFGNPGMGYYDGPGEGPGLLARTLELNVGLWVDHYIAVDLQTFMRFIDAVGGVDINLPSSVDLNDGHGTPDPRYILQAGTQHLGGSTALMLAINRVPSTFQRMVYQKMIMTALREKLLSPVMLPKVPGLVSQFISSVQTDLGLVDIDQLICIGQAIPKENILADSFPRELFTATVTYDENRAVTTFIYEADFEKLRAMVSDFMNGIWPMP